MDLVKRFMHEKHRWLIAAFAPQPHTTQRPKNVEARVLHTAHVRLKLTLDSTFCSNRVVLRLLTDDGQQLPQSRANSSAAVTLRLSVSELRLQRNTTLLQLLHLA